MSKAADKTPSLDLQLGRYLRRAKDTDGLTLRALAAQVGLRHPTIHRLINGDRGASLKLPQKIMTKSGVSLADLFPEGE